MAKKILEFNIGETLDPLSIGQREFDLNEIINYIAGTGWIRASWAFESPVIIVKKKVFRFTVHGYHHKGYVYVILDWSDTFTIYYTNPYNVVKKKSEMIYIDQLIEVLDTEIEKIPEYVR